MYEVGAPHAAPTRRADRWLAAAGLLAALLVLPSAPGTFHNPEMAATLAVGAVAVFAGQRWGLAIMLFAELLLIPTSAPRAYASTGILIERLPALLSLLASVPGILAFRRALGSLVDLLPTPSFASLRISRRVRRGLLATIGLIAALLPLI